MILVALSFGKAGWIRIDPKYDYSTHNEVGSDYCWIDIEDR